MGNTIHITIERMEIRVEGDGTEAVQQFLKNALEWSSITAPKKKPVATAEPPAAESPSRPKPNEGPEDADESVGSVHQVLFYIRTFLSHRPFDHSEIDLEAFSDATKKYALKKLASDGKLEIAEAGAGRRATTYRLVGDKPRGFAPFPLTVEQPVSTGGFQSETKPRERSGDGMPINPNVRPLV